MTIRIMLAEDQAIMREGLSALVAKEDAMTVVGQAENGQFAVEMALELRPDVVVMDVAMPGLNGMEATRQIRTGIPDAKILALSAYDNQEYVGGMIKAGVSGYLLKDCAFEELVTAIQTVSNGKSYLSPDIARVVLDIQSADAGDSGVGLDADSLGNRDRELIRLLAEGESARDIAEREGQSVKTIEGRRRRIMQRLNINSMAGLVKYAIRNGLVSAKPSAEEALQ